MKKFFSSIITYFYVCIKKGVKCDFPCKASPIFVFRKLKGLKGINLGSAFIGRDVCISDGCHFYENPIIFGKVRIGRYSSVNGPGTRICAGKNGVKIGSFCSIASNVIIQEYNHRTDLASSYNILSGVLHESDCDMSTSKGAIIIEDGVWIGSNSVVLSGVIIGRGAVVGAGSVVVNDVPPYSVVVGNPARVVKYRFSQQSIKEIENSCWWSWSDQTMSENKDFFKKHFD